MGLIGILLVPVIICGAAFFFFKHHITWKEFLLQIVICSVLLIAGWFIAQHEALSSNQFLNGFITQKANPTISCCHCVTICDARDPKTGSCTASHESCDHNSDTQYYLETTVGTIMVNQCIHRTVPQIWADAYIGEPASVEDSYQNYLLADKKSLWIKSEIAKYEPLPQYPQQYNLYHVDHVITAGPPIPSTWQKDLSEINAHLGAQKQLDLTIVLTYNKNPDYARALEAKWLYGPKNSLTIVFGVDKESGNVLWAKAISISKVNELKNNIRDYFPGKNIYTDNLLPVIHNTVLEKFNRTPMANFEYLAKNAVPSDGVLIFLYILSAILSVITSYVAVKNDIFGDEGYNPYRSWN